jgi:hypothetical protein
MVTSGDNAWKNLIPGCFGIADLRFARHPLDEQRAKQMANEAKCSGAVPGEIITAIKEYLASEGASPEHIDCEIKYVHRFLA